MDDEQRQAVGEVTLKFDGEVTLKVGMEAAVKEELMGILKRENIGSLLQSALQGIIERARIGDSSLGWHEDGNREALVTDLLSATVLVRGWRIEKVEDIKW